MHCITDLTPRRMLNIIRVEIKNLKGGTTLYSKKWLASSSGGSKNVEEMTPILGSRKIYYNAPASLDHCV